MFQYSFYSLYVDKKRNSVKYYSSLHHRYISYILCDCIIPILVQLGAINRRTYCGCCVPTLRQPCKKYLPTPFLLNKLQRMGIRGAQHVLLKEYLSKSYQCVKIFKFTNSYLPITYGVVRIRYFNIKLQHPNVV